MAKRIDPMTVVVSVEGGVVSAVFADLPLKIVVVNWDELQAADRTKDAPSIWKHDRLVNMAADLKEMVHTALDPYWHLTAAQRDWIYSSARECVRAGTRGDAEYADSIVAGFVGRMSIAEQLEEINQDHHRQCEHLGFDPATGHPTTE